MHISTTLDIFIGLVNGLVAPHLSEPMSKLAGEILREVEDLSRKVSDLTFDLANEKRHTEELLQQRKGNLAEINEFRQQIIALNQRLNPSPSDPSTKEAIMQEYDGGGDHKQLIKAVKLYRRLTGSGLKEAADQVKTWIAEKEKVPTF